MSPKKKTIYEEYGGDQAWQEELDPHKRPKEYVWPPKEKLFEIMNQGWPPYENPMDMARQALVTSLGAKPTELAENIIHLGCAIMFNESSYAISYLKLLDQLGIKYDFLNKQYCCGYALLFTSADRTNAEEWKENVAQVKTLVQKSLDQAKEMGAKHMYYICMGCIAMAQYCKEGDVSVGWQLDILIEPLKKVKHLKVKPAKVAYYPGCWSEAKKTNPNFELPLDIYRSWLDRIEGIEVIDIPPICCQLNREALVKKIAESNVDYTVTPCNACQLWLKDYAKINSYLLHELLLEAVTYKG
jgi:Fe-S oxidoreductase